MKRFWPILLLLLTSCVSSRHDEGTSCLYAGYFDIIDEPLSVVVISPYDGSRDTLRVEEPLDNIICMSSSDVASLSVLGEDKVIFAVSGLRYITDPDLHSRNVPDIGYEAALDYEKVLSLAPDLIVTYAVSSSQPPYIAKLRSLGVPVLVLYSHLESHPLARAEYVRLFGALVGRRGEADRFFDDVRCRYDSLASSVGVTQRVKVLINAPYGDAWYLPGADSYMSRLIHDAGGVVIGARSGTAVSSVVTLEEAYLLSQEADIWLNPGSCRTRKELTSMHQLMSRFGPVVNDRPIYNNVLRTTEGGGNDFWESGAMRPDLILEDLMEIFSLSAEKATEENLNYFCAIE